MNALNTAWYIFRVVLGFFIHIVLTAAALFNIEVVYEVVAMFYRLHPEEGVYFNPCFMGASLSVSVFFASMAGVYWVKSMYIQNFLPEVMDAASKAIRKQ